MAVDTRLQSPERRATGSWPFWLILFVVGCFGICAGVALSPGTGGFLLLLASGILTGVSYGALMMYLPSFSHRVWTSLVLAGIALLAVGGIALATSRTSPTPPLNSEVLLTPQQGQ